MHDQLFDNEFTCPLALHYLRRLKGLFNHSGFFGVNVCLEGVFPVLNAATE